jgi:methionyl-tRNA formyltransferase
VSEPETPSYLVAGCKPWNREVYERSIRQLPGHWHYAGLPEQLATEAVAALDPRCIFFLHWSWKVAPEIVDRYECIAFHMTDLPYGRGGSPLQNLIVRGLRETRLSAFRMSHEIDAGPVYLKEDLSLEGTAREIYERASELSARMVGRIVRQQPQPVPQEGEVVVFKRRTKKDSEIPADLLSREQIYDFIRMLDCEGYPAAFVERGGIRFELRNARLDDGRLEAGVTISPREEKQ